MFFIFGPGCFPFYSCLGLLLILDFELTTQVGSWDGWLSWCFLPARKVRYVFQLLLGWYVLNLLFPYKIFLHLFFRLASLSAVVCRDLKCSGLCFIFCACNLCIIVITSPGWYCLLTVSRHIKNTPSLVFLGCYCMNVLCILWASLICMFYLIHTYCVLS